MAIKLAKITSGWTGSAYTHAEHQLKQQFHRIAAKRLREVAALMQLPAGSFDVRSNKAGPAVSGETILHTDHVYVQVAMYWGHDAPKILYRTCSGRKDFTGGQNHYASIDNLDTPGLLAVTLMSLVNASPVKQPTRAELIDGDSLFSFTSIDNPTVNRNLLNTDTILRQALGDTAKTTSLLMLLNSGELPELYFTHKGVRVLVSKVRS